MGFILANNHFCKVKNMGLISINGSFGAGQAVAQSSSRNGIQVESSNENNSQAQAASKGQRDGNARALQSASNSAMQGNIAHDTEASQITGLTTDRCDFNILPFRDASIDAAGAWQATGANQINVQTPKPDLQDNLNLAVNVSSAIPSVSSLPTTYPNPAQPFRVALGGSDLFPFGGNVSSNQSAVTPSLSPLPTITPQVLSNFTTPTFNNGIAPFPGLPTFNNNEIQFGELPKPKTAAQSLLDKIRAKNALKNAAQAASAFAVSGEISREHSIGQDGRVLLVDSAGNLANPNNPSATPGYDPVTNTAPGTSSFTVFSGAVAVPNLFIPGPVPGDPNPVVPPRTKSSVRGNIQLASSSNGKAVAQKGNQSQLQNKSALATTGSFNGNLFSLIGIA